MGDLAELVLVTTSGVTRVVDRLVEAGLVERVRPDNDRRVVTVSMTPAGKKTLRKASAIHTPGIAEYFSDLIETEELPVLERFFFRLATHHTNQGGACDAHVEQLSITPTNR
jgi:DNA-binding MarR family transcriptional regulator